MKLRKWQTEALAAWEANQDGAPIIWAVMGAGKSIAISEMCRRRPDDIIVITAPTIALVDQLSATVESVTGEPVGRWYTHGNTRERITVACHASLDTLSGDVDLWIADEAHKTECDQVKSWVEKTSIRQRVGFSATPYRSSERESVSLFERCIYEYGPDAAYRDGVVVMPRLVYHGQEGQTVDEQCVDFIESQSTPGVANAQTIEDAERFAERLSIPTMVVHSRGSNDADAARAFLASGGHRCVVYVNMLAEGFDCPQIMWIAARRPVRSRVRFAQEVGRGLRAHPGKSECLVFDPRRLFQRLSLSYEACLGVLPPQEEPVPALKLDDVGEDIFAELQKKGAKESPKFHALVEDYLYEVRCELQFRGIISLKLNKESSKKKSAKWRGRKPSDKQINMVTSLARRAGRYSSQWPERVRIVLRLIWPDVPFMNQGAVSDLISILQAADKITN